MTPAAGSCPEPGRRTAAPAPGRAGSPRCWSRSSTTGRCTRCGPRWRRTPRGPGCPRAGPGTWSWWCTSWPPTRSGTAADPDAARWRAEPGHGLWLARQVADQASVDSGPSGTVATVSFALRPPGDPAPPGLARRSRDGCVIVTVTGPLDLGSSGRLTRAVGGLARATPGLRLVLDLSGLTGWDS